MTLLQQEKSSEKSSLEKQIEDVQQSMNRKDKELMVVKGELQQVCSPFSIPWFQGYFKPLCSSRKYPYSPHGNFFILHPPLPPGNSSLFSYISSKNLAFKTPPPSRNFQ